MYRAYSLLTEHTLTNSQWNAILHDRTRDLAKYLPSGKRMEENLRKDLAFVRLQTVLHLFLTKSFNLRLQFVQLFEIPSVEEIEMNYKTSVARQFILIGKRQSGLVDNQTPCLIYSENNREIVSIPSEFVTQRPISNDERLYLNTILLYNGLWKNILTKKKQWYWKEISDDEKENFNIEILSM